MTSDSQSGTYIPNLLKGPPNFYLHLMHNSEVPGGKCKCELEKAALKQEATQAKPQKGKKVQTVDAGEPHKCI